MPLSFSWRSGEAGGAFGSSGVGLGIFLPWRSWRDGNFKIHIYEYLWLSRKLPPCQFLIETGRRQAYQIILQLCKVNVCGALNWESSNELALYFGWNAFDRIFLWLVSFLQSSQEHRLWAVLSGSSLSCTILDELLDYSGLALSQLLSGNDRRPYLSREWVKCIKPVPNRQWSLSLGQELLLGLFGAFSECSDVWCNLGKEVLWFMSGSSLTRLNVRRTGVRPVSPARNNFVCLAFPTVRWRARTRWPRSAAVCTRWTPLTRARPPRTPLGLNWPPWDSSQMLTSCARSSASS